MRARASAGGRRWLVLLGLAVAAFLLLAAVPGLPAASPSSPAIVLPAELRVGLATDLEQFEVACCEAPSWLVDEEGRRHPVDGPFVVRPVPGTAAAGRNRLQVAALRDRWQAEKLAARLAERLGQEADAVLDAGSGLYRVRVGRFADREEAERNRGRLRVEGFDDTWITVEGRILERPAFEVEGLGRFSGRRLRLESEGGVVRILGRRYRGALEIFLNDRASLNVMNTATLEDYLRGVVPLELGPDLYPELEATKVQTVAARTYAVAHLGEFRAEGYDLCATPQCQVYGGLDVEHPRSDRAVAETRGQIVLRGGRPLNALYTASCGGRTEVVEQVFPSLAARGLTGTHCVEGGELTLSGGALGPPAAHLLRSAGLRPGDGRRLEARLNRALATGDLEVVVGHLGGLEGDWLDLRERGRRRLVPLAPEGTLRVTETPFGSSSEDLGEPAAAIAAAPGDRLRVYLARSRAVLIVHETPSRRGQPVADPWSVWRSKRSLHEAAEKRFPGLGLVSLRVLERGASGRVMRLDLIGRDRTVELRGLAIRWLLGIPEHLVDLADEPNEHGAPGWRFRGSGRGHAVGMCQIGAHLMAERGLTWREILRHYYGAVEIAEISQQNRERGPGR